jgi:hypothetical protein
MTPAKRDTGEQHPVNASCEERNKMVMAILKGTVTGLLAAFAAIGGQYLYASNTFAAKSQVVELKADLKADIKEGFDRIEKRLDRAGRP